MPQKFEYGYTILKGLESSDYEPKVKNLYKEDPEIWKNILGETNLFQFGSYDQQTSTNPVSLDQASIRYFEQQIELAGFYNDDQKNNVKRILDIGFGWGYSLGYLASQFKNSHVDGTNISEVQLKNGVQFIKNHHLSDRVSLYYCNAIDVDLLPSPEQPYDLVFIRGVATHFPKELYLKSMKKLLKRVSEDGVVIISDTLYRDLSNYIPPSVDHRPDILCCGHRKTLEECKEIFNKSGFKLLDSRVLPSNSEACRNLMEIRINFENQYQDVKSIPRGGLSDLYYATSKLTMLESKKWVIDEISEYSLITSFWMVDNKETPFKNEIS
eukprot:gene3304-4139_t